MVASHIIGILFSCLAFEVHFNFVCHYVYRYRVAEIEWVRDISPNAGTTQREDVRVIVWLPSIMFLNCIQGLKNQADSLIEFIPQSPTGRILVALFLPFFTLVHEACMSWCHLISVQLPLFFFIIFQVGNTMLEISLVLKSMVAPIQPSDNPQPSLTRSSMLLLKWAWRKSLQAWKWTAPLLLL